MISIISRLASQKGFDILEQIIDKLLYDRDIQFVLLGTGEDQYQQMFSNLKIKHRDKTAIIIGFDADLAQKIYAASDRFLMPSRFEPCGLGQLICLRYGTIPIVHSTGGLEDTIVDFQGDPDNGNGFSFNNYSPMDLQHAIDRALDLYYNHGDQWKKLMKNAMGADFSWKNSAQKYVSLYKKAIQIRRREMTDRLGPLAENH